MSRWFAILLLVLLPLQTVWAAAAPYCAHEESPASLHIGHHDHEHQGPEQDPDRFDGLAASHTDCHVCHGAACAFSAPLSASGQGAYFGPQPAWSIALPTAPIFLPERPNWARLA
ncbi:hypothetical protein RAMLITH_17180 [Ramlibacter sp. RBP-2]|uniref:Cobalt-zinc-cadmium resistance protein n=1 Tax=Ramlibacter lithotrophicus TaxID=2606681 RepID=A0A7X6DI30_9BURK|nr:hypothetical protein [Ramlibacter lithotrophicus]NKE67558.1 hypothetical protein [Ramlibacter lithotrophicus]